MHVRSAFPAQLLNCVWCWWARALLARSSICICPYPRIATICHHRHALWSSCRKPPLLSLSLAIAHLRSPYSPPPIHHVRASIVAARGVSCRRCDSATPVPYYLLAAAHRSPSTFYSPWSFLFPSLEFAVAPSVLPSPSARRCHTLLCAATRPEVEDDRKSRASTCDPCLFVYLSLQNCFVYRIIT